MIPFGREFYKLSGSGNDFVFVDTRLEPAGPLVQPEVIGAICNRGNGIGADGVVFLERTPRAAIKLVYINADGSRADLCGNATLCTARMARELGVVSGATDFAIETDVGVIGARFIRETPEIDLAGISETLPDAGIPLEAGETRMGFALAGVPHLAILVDDLEAVDVVGRGRPLRWHQSLKQGANVNFVRRNADGPFSYRTYERGVEAETLACGTGAVATAWLLTQWGLTSGPVTLRTRSGRALRVRFWGAGAGAKASLSGEARLVFAGRFGELPSH
ncbi:MAG TPA: diaminopimelate epimerase [Pirellulaceae bacterium]|nr:diaminopimelate epimerase [Pirellulaceae bacterium]